MAKTQGKAKFLLILSVLISLLLLLSYVLLKFSLYLTPAGSILLFFVITWIFFSNLIQLIVFPGGTCLYRRGIETRYCRDLSLQLINSLHAIISSLTTRPKSNIYFSRPTFNGYCDFSTASREILQVKEILFMLQEQHLLSTPQKLLLSQLTELLSALNTYSGKSDQNYSFESENILLEDDSLAEKINSICISVIKSLEWYTNDSNCRYWLIFLSRKPLGSLNYMRCSLLSKVPAQQIWVPTEDESKLDW